MAPQFYARADGDELDSEASMLTVWRDLESVSAFAYSGPHLEAFRRRLEWFEPREPHRWPRYVAWWTRDDEVPSWDDAYARPERLRHDGPTPVAVDVRPAFDAADQSAKVRRPRDGDGITTRYRRDVPTVER